MGLDFPAVTAKLLPIKSVAVTGGDPFFPMGTDIAILFETEKPEALYNTLQKAIALKATINKATQHKIESSTYTATGYTNQSRSFSSYIIRHGNLVAVTNSPAQIKHLAAVQENKTPSLGSTDEFKYFRHRYPLSNSIFIFLSDETIRRWSGPKTRIGASRRTRAAAALGKLTSQKINNEKLTTDLSPLLGETTSNKNQIQSQTFNNLNFITPVSELEIKTATSVEAAAYNQWRRGYESGWATVFDPIAIQLDLTEDTHEIDLTVLPLTVNSDLNNFLQLVGNAKLSPLARATPEGTLLLASVALDSNSDLFKDFNTELTSMLPGIKVNPLSWVGESASIYVNDGFIWKALQQTDATPDMIGDLPILIRVESKSSLKLTLFLTALRGMMDTSAPGLVTWEKRQHGKTPYLSLKGNEEGLGANINIYYAALPTAFLITLDEDMLKQAIDRENTPLTNAQKQKLPTAQHLFFETSPAFLAGTNKIFNDQNLAKQTQQESYKALPILNEWHRLYPDRDPIQVHREHFASDIHCPGGKGYQWNPKAHTMESIAFGHPANPKTQPNPISLLTKFQNLRTSMTFQDGGVRIKAKLGPTEKRILKNTNNPQKVGPLLATATDLTPTTAGTVQTYNIKRESNPDQNLTLKIVSVELKNEATQTIVETTFNNDGKQSKSKKHYTLQNGLKLTRQTSENFTTEYAQPFYSLPEKLTEGETLAFPFQSKSSDAVESINTGQVKITTVGTENITVPAGTFKDCIKLEIKEVAITRSLTINISRTAWYHKNTGLIKMIVTNPMGKSTIELTKTTTP